MAVIKVPRPPAEAHNENRPISDLLKAQLEHFRHVEERYFASIKTEAQAANYIRHVTQFLHPEGAMAERASQRTRPSLILGAPVGVPAGSRKVVVLERIAAQADIATIEPAANPEPKVKTKSRKKTTRNTPKKG